MIIFKFKKNVNDNIYAPVDDRLIALGDVPGQVFTSEMLGGGAAIEVMGEEIYAPYDGRLVMLADTKHAFRISAGNGVEVLAHIGLDTMEFNSTGFTALKAVNDRVKKGIPIIRLDREFFQSRNAYLIAPVLISNSTGCPFAPKITGKEVMAGESIVIRFQ